jgi:hypothetical protein
VGSNQSLGGLSESFESSGGFVQSVRSSEGQTKVKKKKKSLNKNRYVIETRRVDFRISRLTRLRKCLFKSSYEMCI